MPVIGGANVEQGSAGGGGTSDHAALSHLDYASAAHTGFSPAVHSHAPGDITPQGTGSTLDADLLDGNHALAFALHQSGFPAQTTGGTIFFDVDGSVGHQSTPRTFYIYGSFTIRVKEAEFTKATIVSTAEFFQIPNVSGAHHIVYDSTGALKEITTDPPDWEVIFYQNCYVATVYWNATDGELVYFGDERHGTDWPWSVHAYEHIYERTQYKSGLGIAVENIDGSGDDPEDARIAVADGVIDDEDLEWAITDDDPQGLSPIAQIPILYRSGATEWRLKPADNYPVVYSDGVVFTGANGRLPWNEFTGGAWQLTEVTNLNFVLVHYVATNDVNNPIIGIQGQADYLTITAARNGSLTGVPSTLDHASLINLDYASAGHTGFEPTVTKGDLTATSPLQLDQTRQVIGGAAVVSILSAYTPRERLTGNRTYYVRTDGNDSNDGSANDAAHAFLTIQHGLDVPRAALDFRGYTVTVSVQTGTYDESIVINGPHLGGGSLVVDFVSATIQPSSGNCFRAEYKAEVTLQNPIVVASAGSGLLAIFGGVINVSGITCGACSVYHMYAMSSGSLIVILASYSITGNATAHKVTEYGGSIRLANAGAVTVTLTGTRAFTYFAWSQGTGQLVDFNVTYSGSATGQRYYATLNGIINTYGAGATLYPGDVAGTVVTGGQYA